MGIVGLGQIGQATARIALGMGMKVIASHKHPERDAMDGVRFTSLEECFRESDVISLHCPLNKQNKEFVNKKLLEVMTPSAYLINTSRGPLLHEADVAEELSSRRIYRGGLAVIDTETNRQS